MSNNTQDSGDAIDDILENVFRDGTNIARDISASEFYERLNESVGKAKAAIQQYANAAREDELLNLRGVVYGISGDGTVAEVLQLYIDAVLAQLHQDPEKGKK